MKLRIERILLSIKERRSTMENNKNNMAKKDTRNEKLENFNDQLGENASEEYKSEEYANAFKNENKNKSVK
jgi:hypothetical protein